MTKYYKNKIIYILIFIVSLGIVFSRNISENNIKYYSNNTINSNKITIIPQIINNINVSDTPEIALNTSTNFSNTDTPRIDISDPINIITEEKYNPISGNYEIIKRLGSIILEKKEMTFDEYQEYSKQKLITDFWKNKSSSNTKGNTLKKNNTPLLDIDKDSNLLLNLCDGKLIDLKPQGTADIKLGANTNKIDNPNISEKNRSSTSMDFDQQIQVNLQGSICNKFNINLAYNTKPTFAFDNKIKLAYDGGEDQILQHISAGNVSFETDNTLISGSQSLTGIKAKLKFGKLTINSLISKQEGEKKEIKIEGGALKKDFEIDGDDYEDKKHFFLSHYFRDNYEDAMKTLPNVQSEVRITKVEVWITNKIRSYENNRNILAFMDLGESRVLENSNILVNVNPKSTPDNNNNNLFSYLNNNQQLRLLNSANTILSNQTQTPGKFQIGQHYEKLEYAKLLSPSEYTYNSLLGYISLRQTLDNDEVLAVAFQYTYRGRTYQVGEFSTDGVPSGQAMYMKLIKGTNLTPRYKNWDLMMKNIYNIGAYRLNSNNFNMQVWYKNPKDGFEINYLPYNGVNNKLLIQVLGADRLNKIGEAYSDGVFDYIPLNENGNQESNGGTIIQSNGRIIFPILEPFGESLEKKLLENGIAQSDIKNIIFSELYDSSQINAKQFPEKNRFKIKGQYEGDNSSEISLNTFNIPRGSVQVTAGGILLKENQDYTVDYNIGRVKILNDAIIQSGTDIKISLESNSSFKMIDRSLIGTQLNYDYSKNINFGTTFLRYQEKPTSYKVNIGNEPVKNMMFGVNANYSNEVPFLTKLTDKIPFIDTKEKSMITAKFEGAYLIPGHNSRAISKEGISYIDDFESSQSGIDLRAYNSWQIASIPQGLDNQFPEAQFTNDLRTGNNRAAFNWYVISPSDFYDKSVSVFPDYIYEDDIQHNHLMREVKETEVFPNKTIDNQQSEIDRIAMFNIRFNPKVRGPYNYDTEINTYSSGLDNSGLLKNPTTRWGGIMRELYTTDFEEANIEYINFWLMDPFSDEVGGSNVDATNKTGGDLYFHLGDISEDIMKDGIKMFENGMSTTGNLQSDIMAETNLGRIPTTQNVSYSFDVDGSTRGNQDVGFDGLEDANERLFFKDYLNWVNNSSLSQTVKNSINNDPSNDDYTYYRDDRYNNNQTNIIDRYLRYNGFENNSHTTEESKTINSEGFPTSRTLSPDVEDINKDNNLSETERYYQYKVSIRPENMIVGQNNIVDKVSRVHNASGKEVTWYQFRIPIRVPEKVINGIDGYKSIRFMRIITKNFSEEIMMRFARLELLRGTWRTFPKTLRDPGEYIQIEPKDILFNISSVNLEENSDREPINYVLPPNIQREIDPNTNNTGQYLNEQSMELEVCGLDDGMSRAAYKNVNVDMINYNKLKMYIHAEDHTGNTQNELQDNQLVLFLRLGTDFEYNYYEYQIPLKVSTFNTKDEYNIWPIDNNLELNLSELIELKKERNKALNSGGISINTIFEKAVSNNSNHIIKIIGNPNIRDLKNIMIGLKNPHKDGEYPWKPDDGSSICAKVWVNELRLTDFKNDGGYAVQSQIQTNLADFADIRLAGHYSTDGFGSIDQKLNDRQKEDLKRIDASSNINIGKFFKEEWGVQLPLFLSYSEQTKTPLYDPLNPDVELNESIKDYDNEIKNKKRREANEILLRKSLSLSNIKISPKNSKKSYPWSLKNFGASYSYNESYLRDINTSYAINRNHNGFLNYNYSIDSKPFSPFKDNKFLRKHNWTKLVRDFSISPLPNNLSIMNTLSRTYNESEIRDNTGYALVIPIFSKTFYWDRIYNLSWNFTKNISIAYTALNNAIVEEPGDLIVNKENYPDEYKIVKSSILNSLQDFGKSKHFNQSVNVSYNWPINSIPYLEFINLRTSYSSSFDWQPISYSQDSLGNLIQNTRAINWNANLNMSTFYNKFKFIKKALNSKNSKEKVDRDRYQKDVNSEDYKKDKYKTKISGVKIIADILTMVKTINATYQTSDGTILPGYSKSPQVFGLNNFTSPGITYVFGGNQERDIFGRETNNDFANKMYQNNWMITSANRYINQQHSISHSKSFTLNSQVKPIDGFNLSINANYVYNEMMNENFIWDSNNNYSHLNTYRSGSYNMTYNLLRNSLFNKISSDELFQNLLDNREKSSQILADKYKGIVEEGFDSSGIYHKGFGATQQDVLISSFIRSYSGMEHKDNFFTPHKLLPMLNWSLNITSLNKIKALKNIFTNISIRHTYRSSLNVATFATDLTSKLDTNSIINVNNNNFKPEIQIMNVSLTESFSPFVGIDMKFKNSLNTKFEYAKSKSMSLSLLNNQITEMNNNELTVGLGYIFKKVKFPFKIMNKSFENDIITNFDFTLRQSKTLVRKIESEQSIPVSGQKLYYTIRLNADYKINDNFTLRFYYDRTQTVPYIVTSYPIMNQNVGLGVRINLFQ